MAPDKQALDKQALDKQAQPGGDWCGGVRIPDPGWCGGGEPPQPWCHTSPPPALTVAGLVAGLVGALGRRSDRPHSG